MESKTLQEQLGLGHAQFSCWVVRFMEKLLMPMAVHGVLALPLASFSLSLWSSLFKGILSVSFSFNVFVTSFLFFFFCSLLPLLQRCAPSSEDEAGCA